MPKIQPQEAVRPENVQALVVESGQQLGFGGLAIGLADGDAPGFALPRLEFVAERGDGHLQRLRRLRHLHGGIVAVEAAVAHLRSVDVERAHSRSRAAFDAEAALLVGSQRQPFLAQQLAFALHFEQDACAGGAAA